MRIFKGGATRDTDDAKPDLEGFLSPLVLDRFAEYMTKHRVQADGKIRDSDNWQKGIPLEAYMKGGWRHFHDWWRQHRLRVWYGEESAREEDDAELEEALCALMFNVMGYLHEHMKAKLLWDYGGLEDTIEDKPVQKKKLTIGGVQFPMKNAGSPKAPDRSEEEHGT